MSLPYGLLGLLTYQESTGYELTKMFRDSLNNFWHAQSSQIYRELNRLEEQGFVSSRSILQEGRPNKRLYAITQAGNDALAAWLQSAKVEFEHPHHAALLRVFFGADDPNATLALLQNCLAQCEAALAANHDEIGQNIQYYANVIPGGAQKSKYWAMTLEFGIAQTQATMEWARRCIAQIEGERPE